MVGPRAGRHARPSVMRWGVLRRPVGGAKRRQAGRPWRVLRQGAAAPRQGRSAARGPERGREGGGWSVPARTRRPGARRAPARGWPAGGGGIAGASAPTTPWVAVHSRPAAQSLRSDVSAGRRPRFQDLFRPARYVPAVRSTRGLLRRTCRRSLLGSTESSPGPNAMIEAIRPARAPRSPVPLLLPVSLRGAARAARLGRGNPSDPAQARPAHHGELLPAAIAGPWGLVRVGRA